MRILVVDDDSSGRELLAQFLEDQLGHEVTQADNGEAGLKAFRQSPFPLVISDIRMPRMDGIELLKRIKDLPEGPDTDVILVTGFGDMDSAIDALRSGAYDYQLKPVNLEEIEFRVNRIVEHLGLKQDNYELNHKFDSRLARATRDTNERLDELRKAYAEMVGIGRVGFFSDAMREVADLAMRLHEDPDVPVLIEGETGTGKEIVARLVHYGDGDVTTPFVPLNCSAIAPNLFESELFGYEGGAFSGSRREGQTGKLELASGGTVFLDELGDMPLEMQPKLLRVLQDREFFKVGGVRKVSLDARVICATNQNLPALIREKGFRQDLFYRLNVGRILVPPLRERTEDIEPLARMFLDKFAGQKKRSFRDFHEDALKMLTSYSWPGNVRELENTIERVVLLNDEELVRPEHLRFLHEEESPAAEGRNLAAAEADPNTIVISFPPDGLDMRELEGRIISKALEIFKGNKSATARYLGINRNTLINKAKDID